MEVLPVQNSTQIREKDHISFEVTSRLNSISFQKANEIEIIAKQILQNLNGPTSKKIINFTKLESQIAHNFQLSLRTRQSAGRHLVSIREIYSEPQLWITTLKTSEFQNIIALCFEKKANLFCNLSLIEKQTLLEDQQKDFALRRKNQKKLKRFSSGDIKPHSSTLTERQKEHEQNIECWIEDLRLTQFRNKEVPLHDDNKLLARLIEKKPELFISSIEFFGDNEELSLSAISRGHATLVNLSPSIAKSSEILRAESKRSEDTVAFCAKYYLPLSGSLFKSLGDICSELSLDEVSRDVEETMIIISQTCWAEDVITANDIALSCFNLSENQSNHSLFPQIEYLIHFRMLLNELLKEEGLLDELQVFASETEDALDATLVSRAQKNLDFFR